MAKKHQEEDGGEEKAMGYILLTDMFSQVMIFFILLYTIQTQFKSKEEPTVILEQIRNSFRKDLKIKTVDAAKIQPQVTEIKKLEPKPIDKQEKLKQAIVADIMQMIRHKNLDKFLDVLIEDKRIRLIFDQPILYDTASAVLKEDFEKYLSPVGDMLLKYPNNIVIEGHTDNIPIGGKYGSNWVLSFNRAYSVLQYFVETKKIAPERMSVIGYGEYRPRFPNDQEEGRQKNRRIEVNILIFEGAEKPAKKTETPVAASSTPQQTHH